MVQEAARLAARWKKTGAKLKPGVNALRILPGNWQYNSGLPTPASVPSLSLVPRSSHGGSIGLIPT